jgi:excinuclease ABC subunit C
MIKLTKLKEKVKEAPDSAGVYLMKDAAGEVIYVGKAKSLKKRLGSYFGRELATKTMAMMENVADIEYRLTPAESLALILESSLVHRHRPRYNVMLRDDKSFPLVKITADEFPGVCITRKRAPDGSRYFGPYPNAKLLREALKIIRRSFPYRTCKQMPEEACMYYRIGLSPAPCIGKIDKREYAKTIENIALILDGKTDCLIKKLAGQMRENSERHEFEEAAKLRDQINALTALGWSKPGFNKINELEDLRHLAGLRKIPERVEAFDISNISGREACGSMVNFYRGVADKNNYRKFRIKTIFAVDDYAMLKEVVRRRYSRVIEEHLPQPDLILVDGGLGHLGSAEEELKNLGLHIPLIAIAKDRENIYLQGKQGPIKLKEGSPALNLIRHIRDEAHRFAISYHHVLRRKKIIGR